MGRNPCAKISSNFPGDFFLLGSLYRAEVKSCLLMRPSSREWSRQWGLSWRRFNCLPEELIGWMGAIPSNSLCPSGGITLVWLLKSKQRKCIRRVLSLSICLISNMQNSECVSMKILLLWKPLPESSPGGLNTRLRSLLSAELSWRWRGTWSSETRWGTWPFILVSLLLVVDIHEGVVESFVLGLTRRLELFYLRKESTGSRILRK